MSNSASILIAVGGGLARPDTSAGLAGLPKMADGWISGELSKVSPYWIKGTLYLILVVRGCRVEFRIKADCGRGWLRARPPRGDRVLVLPRVADDVRRDDVQSVPGASLAGAG